MSNCACGVPNRANTHYSVVVGRPGERSDVDVYMCTEHDPGTEDPADMRPLLAFDGADDWEILEVTRTEIR